MCAYVSVSLRSLHMICKSTKLRSFLAGDIYESRVSASTSAQCFFLPLVVGDLTGRGHIHPRSPFSVSKQLTRLLSSPSAVTGSAVFTAIKIQQKMESFICKTNNAEEIKHSGELSGPFKNQYEAFHLRSNLFLVIILHILCPLSMPAYTQTQNVPHTCT